MTATVSVVVPTYASRRWLPGLLGSLAAQTLAPLEVIAVDNGSGDGTLEWLATAHPAVRAVGSGENAGFAAAANRGIALARGELVALLNPDVVLDPDWLERLAGRFEDPGIGSAAGRMLSLADRREIYDAGDLVRRDGACLQRGRGERDGPRFRVPGETFGPCAGAAMYRRAALAAVGGFDERYFLYLEDADLALALRAAGWRCAYEPAGCEHAGEGSAAAPGAHRYWVARNTPVLVAKWFPLRWLGLVAYRQAALLVLAVRERRLRAHLRALADGVRLVPAALRERPRVSIPRAELIPGPRFAGRRPRVTRAAAPDRSKKTAGRTGARTQAGHG